jgi:hypothetical protein
MMGPYGINLRDFIRHIRYDADKACCSVLLQVLPEKEMESGPVATRAVPSSVHGGKLLKADSMKSSVIT